MRDDHRRLPPVHMGEAAQRGVSGVSVGALTRFRVSFFFKMLLCGVSGSKGDSFFFFLKGCEQHRCKGARARWVVWVFSHHLTSSTTEKKYSATESLCSLDA